MKKYLLFALWFLFINSTFSQNPYYDAIKLSTFIEPGIKHAKFIIPDETKDSTFQKKKMLEYCKILNFYYNNKFINSKDIHQRIGAFVFDADSLNPDFNPFLSPFLSPGEVQSYKGGAYLDRIIESKLSSISGLDVTNIADGLAKFLVKRTKEELNVAFFSRFKTTLNDSKYADLKVLFPGTWDLLDAIGDEIYNYNKYIQNLQEAFQSDIKSLDTNLPGIISNHQDFFDSHFEYATSINSACYITKSLRDEIHPGEMLDKYPMDYLKKAGDKVYYDKNWSGTVQTLQLISESLRDTVESNQNYWVSFNKIKELINNKDAFQIYLGLIYQVAKNERYKSIEYKSGSFIELLNKFDFNNDFPAYKNYISNLALKLDDLNQKTKKYAKPANDSIAIENYTKYFKATVEFLEYGLKVSTLPHFKDVISKNFVENLKIYFKIIDETADIAIDINRRNYSSAINHTLTIYNLVRTKPLENDLSTANSEKKSVEKENLSEKKNQKALRKYNKALDNLIEFSEAQNKELLRYKIDTTLKSATIKIPGNTYKINELQDSLKLNNDLSKKLAQYGSFIATISTAKSSDEVEEAIEASALPSGSSRIKRETPFNVSLNAYTGLFMGHELITGVKDSHWINSYGLTAPVGVAISTGSHKFLGMPCLKDQKHWSYSAFISLIDIGTIAAFRFQNNDSIAQIPSIKLQDIFSPGLFFSIGIPKCPLSFNLGAQVGPNLRNVNIADDKNPGKYINAYQDQVYWRFSGSILVDIPLINVYTRSK